MKQFLARQTKFGIFLASALALGVFTTAPRAMAEDFTTPITVDAGAQVQVQLPSATEGGRVELWGPVTQGGVGARMDAIPADGMQVTINAPSQAGSYELRYVGADDAMIAHVPFDVASAPVVLRAPSEVGAGGSLTVLWQGPGREGDAIELRDPATNELVDRSLIISGSHEVSMIAPQKQGSYELRYWSEDTQSVLRTFPIAVGEPRDWLRSPIEIVVGTPFDVHWSGPIGASNVIQILDPASGSVVDEQPLLADGDTGGVAHMTAPERDGQYRIRHVDGSTGMVFTEVPIDVDPR